MKPSRYSIILPVRNGGEYLKLCVESILNQAYDDFNLEILENCSTDGTPEWLATLKDTRIRIWPASSPLSIEENWRRILEIRKNEYMTIIGHDDLLDANYLSVMDQLIQQYPDAGLYQAHFRIIDAKGKTIRSCFPMPERETASEFLAARLAQIRDSFGTGYMMRAKDYERVGGIPSYAKLLYADDALWLMLMESSWKATSFKECFAYRLYPASTSCSTDPSSLFTALEQYSCFLEELSRKKEEIAKLIKIYGNLYFLTWCRYYYKFLLEKECLENQSGLSNEIYRIQSIIDKLNLQLSLKEIEDYVMIAILKFINKLAGKNIIFNILNYSQQLGLRIVAEIIKLYLKIANKIINFVRVWAGLSVH